MLETDIKQTQKAEWLKTHTLSPEQLKQLIQNKLVRAAQFHDAVRKREALLEDR